MEFDIKSDIESAKLLLKLNDKELAEKINVSRMTLLRMQNNSFSASKKTIKAFYDFCFSNGIWFNLINEEIYKSNEDRNRKILFHGSKEGIFGELSFSYSGEKKDFGKGFYLGESMKQGISFVSNYENSCVYIFSLNTKNLKIKEFDVSKEWMILVAYNRGRLDEYRDSKVVKRILDSLDDVDLVIAPIADNSMYSIINEFIEGSITDEQCINAISANRLGRQYVIINEKILKTNLRCLKKCHICEEEKKEYEANKNAEKNLGKSKVILAKRKYAGKGLYIEELLK